MVTDSAIDRLIDEAPEWLRSLIALPGVDSRRYAWGDLWWSWSGLGAAVVHRPRLPRVQAAPTLWFRHDAGPWFDAGEWRAALHGGVADELDGGESGAFAKEAGTELRVGAKDEGVLQRLRAKRQEWTLANGPKVVAANALGPALTPRCAELESLLIARGFVRVRVHDEDRLVVSELRRGAVGVLLEIEDGSESVAVAVWPRHGWVDAGAYAPFVHRSPDEIVDWTYFDDNGQTNPVQGQVRLAEEMLVDLEDQITFVRDHIDDLEEWLRHPFLYPALRNYMAAAANRRGPGPGDPTPPAYNAWEVRFGSSIADFIEPFAGHDPDGFGTPRRDHAGRPMFELKSGSNREVPPLTLGRDHFHEYVVSDEAKPSLQPFFPSASWVPIIVGGRQFHLCRQETSDSLVIDMRRSKLMESRGRVFVPWSRGAHLHRARMPVSGGPAVCGRWTFCGDEFKAAAEALGLPLIDFEPAWRED